jgi:hypothetical protein
LGSRGQALSALVLSRAGTFQYLCSRGQADFGTWALEGRQILHLYSRGQAVSALLLLSFCICALEGRQFSELEYLRAGSFQHLCKICLPSRAQVQKSACPREPKCKICLPSRAHVPKSACPREHQGKHYLPSRTHAPRVQMQQSACTDTAILQFQTHFSIPIFRANCGS